MPLEGKAGVLRGYRGDLTRLVRAVALEATSRIVMKTPVDTGRARGNWNVAKGTPDRSHDTNKFDKNGQATTSAALGSISALEAGDVAYITNSVPYVEGLENGRSRQAPMGMIRVTQAELEHAFPDIVRTVRAGGGE